MNADSVKAKLKSFAIKNGYTFQEALTYYGLERTIYRISVAFKDEFLEDQMHQTRWASFLKKKKALVQVPMADAIGRIKIFATPLFEGAELTKWDPEKGQWE